MRDDERQGFGECIEALCAVYGVQPTLALVTGYWMGLEDLQLGAIRAAVARAMKQGGKYMPKPAELRALSGERTSQARALDAWHAVKQALSRVGAYQSIVFNDPLATHTVRMLGGWPRLCSLESEEINKWVSKDFQRIYCDFAESGRYVDPSPLRGLHAIDAAGKQLEEPRPVLVVVSPVERKQLEAVEDMETTRIGDDR